MKNRKLTPILRVLDIYPTKELASLLGCTPQSISTWKLRGIPAARCVQIEKISKGRFTRAMLRPDLFQ